MKRQEKGQVIILVLILLAVGALLIVPTLQYASTGLKAYQVSRELLTEQYAADAAVEDAMWRLKFNVDFPDPDPPEIVNRDSLVNAGDRVTYSVTVNGIQVPVVVELPNQDPEPAPEKTPGIHLHAAADRNPRWTKPGANTFTYTIIMANYGTAMLQVREIQDLLPPGYSYDGPTLGEFYKTNTEKVTFTDDPTTLPDGKLQWILPNPNVGRSWQGVPPSTLSFSVTADPDWGIYYNQAWVSYKEFGKEEIVDETTDEAAPIWVNIYHVKAQAGKVTIRASVALTTTGELKLLSWQEE